MDNKKIGRVKEPFRMTHQREIILDVVKSVEKHLSADEVYYIVRQKLPRISLGTIYRNLEMLSNQGLIKKIVLPGCQKRFDSSTSSHFHVICEKCGAMNDVPDLSLSEQIKFAEKTSGYSVTGLHLDFKGICPKCSAKQQEKRTQNIDSSDNDIISEQ